MSRLALVVALIVSSVGFGDINIPGSGGGAGMYRLTIKSPASRALRDIEGIQCIGNECYIEFPSRVAVTSGVCSVEKIPQSGVEPFIGGGARKGLSNPSH